MNQSFSIYIKYFVSYFMILLLVLLLMLTELWRLYETNLPIEFWYFFCSYPCILLYCFLRQLWFWILIMKIETFMFAPYMYSYPIILSFYEWLIIVLYLTKSMLISIYNVYNKYLLKLLNVILMTRVINI